MIGLWKPFRGILTFGANRRISLHVVLVSLLVLHLPATAANIEVNETCTLVDAIDAANNDDDSGGLCPPGGSGADVLELTADIELVALHNTTTGANGLPVIVTDMTIAGGGFEISRAPTAPDFRFFEIDSNAELVLDHVTLSGGVGTAGFYGPSGGAIYGDFGTVELVGSTLSGNSAEAGGAIFASFTTVRAMNSTLSGNYASDLGGAIGMYQGFVDSTNSTFSGNTAGYLGGAIWGGYASAISLVNTTVASNTAAVGGGVSDYGSFSIPIYFYGSALGYNGGGNCATYFVSDNGGNLDNDGTCGVSATLAGLDPTLADNGGPTHTHALLAGSSAIDAAGTCGLAEDQRGFARDPLCDSGSVEFGAAPVGGSTFGHRVQQVTCQSQATGQVVSILQPSGAWDCEAAGLVVNSGDRLRQIVIGSPGAADLGGTAIGLRQLKVRCKNPSTTQEVQFVPAGTLTWSCLDEGLVYQPNDRVRQEILGVAN